VQEVFEHEGQAIMLPGNLPTLAEIYGPVCHPTSSQLGGISKAVVSNRESSGSMQRRPAHCAQTIDETYRNSNWLMVVWKKIKLLHQFKKADHWDQWVNEWILSALTAQKGDS